MTKQSLASLCIKLMAVYMIVSCIPALPQYLYILGDTRNVWMSLAMMGSLFMTIVICLGLGFLIIRFADAIARRLVPDDVDAGVISISGGDSLYKVFFVCR